MIQEENGNGDPLKDKGISPATPPRCPSPPSAANAVRASGGHGSTVLQDQITLNQTPRYPACATTTLPAEVLARIRQCANEDARSERQLLRVNLKPEPVRAVPSSVTRRVYSPQSYPKMTKRLLR